VRNIGFAGSARLGLVTAGGVLEGLSQRLEVVVWTGFAELGLQRVEA